MSLASAFLWPLGSANLVASPGPDPLAAPAAQPPLGLCDWSANIACTPIVRCVGAWAYSSCYPYDRAPPGQDVVFYWAGLTGAPQLLVHSYVREVMDNNGNLGVIGRCSGSPLGILSVCGPFQTLAWPDEQWEANFGRGDRLWATHDLSAAIPLYTIGIDPTPPTDDGPTVRWAKAAAVSAIAAAQQIALATVNTLQAELQRIQQPPEPLPAGWEERVLLEKTVPLSTPDTGLDILTLQGGPSAQNPAVYEVHVAAAGQPLPTVSLFTGGLVPPLQIQIPPGEQEYGTLLVSIAYRYDPNQEVPLACLGSTCIASPLNPLGLGWVTTYGKSAELIVHAKLVANGQVLRDQFVKLPVLGQLGAAVN